MRDKTAQRPLAAPRQNSRRRYLVRPTFQLRMALTMGLTVFVVTGFLSSVLYGVLHHQARLRMINPTSYTAEVPLVVLGFGLLLTLVCAGTFGVWCIVATHRICGPLVRMEHYLNELREGRFPEVRPLRKNDELKDLFALLERTIQAMKERQSASAPRAARNPGNRCEEALVAGANR